MKIRFLLLFISLSTFLSAQPLNGFELIQLLIPYEAIKFGGPPKDGIPSIDQPQFVSIEKAKDFLSKKDYVIGIEINGIAKAYPIRILNYHEIVNDHIEDAAITVTYCPLCASGAIFSAEVNGQRRTFGVSGLLYNSDVLIYDRETQSLWSQILSEAIAGPSSGQKLELLPSTYTTFKQWSTLHPQTLVLSTTTGYNRDYQKSPYKDYPTSNRLLFPVEQESKALKRKDKVIGIEVDGQFKAYSFKKLKKRKSPLTDTFNGKTFIIHYDPKAKSAQITDTNNQVLESMTLYWFAWYTFHLETDLYK